MDDRRPRVRMAIAGLRRSGGARRARIADLIEHMLFHRTPERHDGFQRTATTIVVASYNIHKAVGTDGRFDPERIVEVMAELDADVLALQEADRRLGVRSGLLDLDRVRARTGLTLMPCAARPASHGWHGNAIFVREGTATRVKRLSLPSAEPRGAVMCELKLPQGELRVVGAHLGLLKHWRRQQTGSLIQALDRGDPMPTLLMGDFNEWRADRPDSPLAALEPFFGPLRPGQPSFPAGRPIFALDRIIGWPDGIVRDFAVHHTPLSRIASDHLPVKALVDLAAPLPLGALAAAEELP